MYYTSILPPVYLLESQKTRHAHAIRGVVTIAQFNRSSFFLELPTFPNIADIKNAFLFHALPLQCLFQSPRRLQYVLLSEHPRPPVDTHRLLAFCVEKYVDRVLGVRVHGAHHEAWHVRADGDQAEIERPAELANLLEGWAGGQVGQVGIVVFFGVVWEAGDGAVTRVAAEVDGRGLWAGGDGPR